MNNQDPSKELHKQRWTEYIRSLVARQAIGLEAPRFEILNVEAPAADESEL